MLRQYDGETGEWTHLNTARSYPIQQHIMQNWLKLLGHRSMRLNLNACEVRKLLKNEMGITTEEKIT